MNAIELFLKDGRSAGVWFCGKCRHVAPGPESAAQCCQNYKCNKCGSDTGSRSWLICDPCRAAEDRVKELERFTKAEKVRPLDWAGPVWAEGIGSEYFPDIEELVAVIEGEEIPKYVWTCNVRPTCLLEVGDIIENATQDAHEDFDPRELHGMDELKVACAAFNEVNKGTVTWEPNFKKAVLL